MKLGTTEAIILLMIGGVMLSFGIFLICISINELLKQTL